MLRKSCWMSALLCAAALMPVGLSAADKGNKKKEPPTGPIDPAGMPEDFEAGKRPMYALWYEGGWWHLRATTTQGEREIFSGSVKCPKGQVSVKVAGADKMKKPADRDWITPSPDGSGFTFKFVNFGKADGVDFRTTAADTDMTFKLMIGGGEAPKKVLIGSQGFRPEKMPFTLPANPGK